MVDSADAERVLEQSVLRASFVADESGMRRSLWTVSGETIILVAALSWQLGAGAAERAVLARIRACLPALFLLERAPRYR